MDPLVVLIMDRLRASRVADRAGYHSIGDHVVYGAAVMAITAAAQSGLTWSGALAVVVGWISGGVRCDATSKGVELSCDLDYTISFWSWALSWKYPHFIEISMFRGYYPHFVEISVFCGYYPHYVEISTFRGYYLHFVHSISHILLI